MYVALGELGLLLQQLIIEVVFYIKILRQKVDDPFGRKHVIDVLRQHQFGLHRHVQQHFEAVGSQFDIAFLGVDRVLESIDAHADLVCCRLLGSSYIDRILRHLLQVLDIYQTGIQEV